MPRSYCLLDDEETIYPSRAPTPLRLLVELSGTISHGFLAAAGVSGVLGLTSIHQLPSPEIVQIFSFIFSQNTF
jgi:hypothetical protein